MGHWWLSQGEESPTNPSIKTRAKHWDPTILASMCDLGYNPQDIQESLLDDSMRQWPQTSC
jgi:hypothetical protein